MSIEFIPKPRFKVGDNVTYKDKKTLLKGAYYFSGVNLAGFVGEIICIDSYLENVNCYSIQVTYGIGISCYKMIESEFEEYDIIKKRDAFTTMLLNRKKFKKNNNGKSKWYSKTQV